MRFVIDGYNLIFSRRRPGRPLRNINIEAARESLLDLLARFKAATGDGLLVFFDGSSEAKGFMRRHRVKGIDIVFSYPDTTADQEIKEYIAGIGGRTGVCLVSSDNSLKTFAKRRGFQVLESEMFMTHLRRALDRRREREADAEPVEKFHGPSPADVEYWLKVFSAPTRKKDEVA